MPAIASFPSVNNGSINLSGIDFNKTGPFELAGEWGFVWDKFVDPEEVYLPDSYMNFPDDWPQQKPWIQRTGYGSYILKITGYQYWSHDEALGLYTGGFFKGAQRILLAVPALQLYQELTSIGIPTTEPDGHIPSAERQTVRLPKFEADEFYIIIHTSNFFMVSGGGPQAPFLGLASQIEKKATHDHYEAHLLVGLFAMLVFFSLSLFIQRPDDRMSLWLALYSFFLMARYIGMERMFDWYLDEPNLALLDFTIRLTYFTSSASVFCLIEYLKTGYPERIPDWFCIGNRWIAGISIVFEIFAPLWVMQAGKVPLIGYNMLVFFMVYFFFLSKSKRLNTIERMQVFSFGLIGICLINDVLSPIFLDTPLVTHYAVLVFCIVQSQVSGIMFANTYRLTKELSEQLQQANEELTEKEQARTIFFHNTSHELRTPLNGIVGFVELLQVGRYGPVTEKMKEQLGKIGKLAQSLKFQVNTILDLAKAKRGELELQSSHFLLNDLSNDIALLAEGLSLKDDKVDFTIHTDWHGKNNPLFAQDREKLLTIIRNLLSNAFKFTDPNKEQSFIRLTLELTTDQQLIIIVEDSGIGIPESKQAHIFEEFKQLEADSRRNFEGTGLGLPLVKQIADMMGAEIFLKSKVGEGTYFKIIVKPAAVEDVVSSIELEQSPLHSDSVLMHSASFDNRNSNPTQPATVTLKQADLIYNARILVVDDNEINCEMISDILKEAGYETVVASGGRQALLALRSFRPDLILLDLMMPEISGEDVLKELRRSQEWCDIPVVLITARASTEDRIFGLSIGADDYIAKPVITQELLFRVHNILERIHLVENMKTMEHQDRLIKLGEMVSDLSHEIKNLHTFSEAYHDIYESKSHFLLTKSPLGRQNWQSLTRFQRLEQQGRQLAKIGGFDHISEEDLVIPENLSQQSKSLLKSLRWLICQTEFSAAERMDLWRKILQMDLEELNHSEALLSCLQQFWTLSNNSIQTSELVRRVLQYDRLSSGAEFFRMADTLDNVLNMLHLRLQRSGIRVDKPEINDLVYGDVVEIQQIITNIISNACDALQQSGRDQPQIRIDWNSAASNPDFSELTIANNGNPIPAEHLERIFTRKFSTKGEKGSGIGLFVSKRLAIRNGGNLIVSSDQDWTVFTLSLRTRKVELQKRIANI